MGGDDGREAGPDGQRPDRLLVAMAPGRDRELLTDWLAGIDGYEVIATDGEGSLPDGYDLALLDPPSLDALRPELESRLSAADPVYLPHVLLTPDDGTGSDRWERAVAADSVIDDLLALPMEKALLRQRLENLLGTRRASRRMTEREEQYRQLVGLMPEAILLADDGEVVYTNRAAGRLFGGGDPEALLGRPVGSLATGDDRSALESLVEGVDRTDAGTRTDVDGDGDVDGGDVNGEDGRNGDADAGGNVDASTGTGPEGGEFDELTLRSDSGEPVEVAVTGVAVTFDGTPAVQLVVRDLTERKQREQQLRLFGRALESAMLGITIADVQQDDNPLIYANEGFERITGYSVDEALGRNCRFLQGSGTSPEPVSTLRRAIGAGEPTSVDILNYRKDGTPFWNRLDVLPITDEGGSVAHFLGFQRDVTERKRREQRLSVLNRVLRHNIRNKLTVVRGYAEEIDAGDPPADAAVRIRDAADELLEIAEGVREFDTVITVDGEGAERIDVAAVVARAVTTLRERSPDAEVTVTGVTEAAVDGHPALDGAIADLLLGLGDSARPRCDIAVRREDGSVIVDVVDRAAAIDRADLELLGHDTETPLEHLQGLELWLLSWTVEQSAGEVRVDTDRDAPLIRLRFPSADRED